MICLTTFSRTKTNLILANPKNSNFYDKANEKVIGKTRDENEGFTIVELVGIKSKMHSS